jgi:uncharacterized protein (TIGR00296 family)
MEASRKTEELAPTASTDHVFYCFDVLSAHFWRALEPTPSFQTNVVCPLFVTWKKARSDGSRDLRGCIGCLRPLPITSLRDYALSSALRDQRFSPMEEREMQQVCCTVSLLTHFEQAPHHLDWELGVHGVMIDFCDPDGVARSAVYLPEIAAEQGWTKQQAVDSLIRKAGYRRAIDDALRASLRITRYKSTAATATYQHWARARKLMHDLSTQERVVAELQAGQHAHSPRGGEPRPHFLQARE